MSKNLLIVFVKNAKLGEVKTRLAKTIGDKGALKVYKHLLEITENVTNQMFCDKHIYFSDSIIDENWIKSSKFIQKGADLGEKMQKAFDYGFNYGYEKIILVGSDLPEISTSIIWQGFSQLEKKEVVFGPAEDGGYYLVGMSKSYPCVFQNKKWSTSGLLKETLCELKLKKAQVSLLQTLNDIDTFDDLKTSKIYNDEKFHFNS
jgi:rSAM/selenodomain-associated transferase 1